MRRAAFLALATLLVAGVGNAHLVFPDVRGERLIEVRLDQDPIRIVYRIGLGLDAAIPIRRAADTNGDFDISAAEGNAALDARTDALLAHLRICTGRSLDDLECRHLTRTAVERVEAQGWVPGAAGDIHLMWTLALPTAARAIGALRIEDAYELPGVEISDVQIIAPAGVPLLSGGEGGRDRGVSTRFNWIEAKRPPGPRVIFAVWPPPPRRAPAILLGLAVALAALLVVLARRRRNAA